MNGKKSIFAQVHSAPGITRDGGPISRVSLPVVFGGHVAPDYYGESRPTGAVGA